MTPKMQIVSVCQEMGWTYKEYMSNPMWVIELIKAKLEIDSDNIKRQSK